MKQLHHPEDSRRSSFDQERPDIETEDPQLEMASIDRLSPDSPVVYHCLEFDTELPAPAYPPNISSDPPPEPDLRKCENPFDWSAGRKNFHVWLSCVATTLTAFAAG